MSAGQQLDRMYGRLAQLALALDELVLEVGAAGLSDVGADALHMVAAHVQLGADGLQDVLYRAQYFGERDRRRSCAIDRELLEVRRSARSDTGGRTDAHDSG